MSERLEGARLESVKRLNPVSRVRIPLSPPLPASGCRLIDTQFLRWSCRSPRRKAVNPARPGREQRSRFERAPGWLAGITPERSCPPPILWNSPMSYLVLARKMASPLFSELVGQQHVVRALVNGIESGRLHHAFRSPVPAVSARPPLREFWPRR